jgi:hypothetical protein
VTFKRRSFPSVAAPGHKADHQISRQPRRNTYRPISFKKRLQSHFQLFFFLAFPASESHASLRTVSNPRQSRGL